MVILSPALFLAFPTYGRTLTIFVMQKRPLPGPPQIRQALFSTTALVFTSYLGHLKVCSAKGAHTCTCAASAGDGRVGRAYPSNLPRHFSTHLASIRTSRAFFKFSFMIQRTSLSGLTSHFSISALPSAGRAATATLQQ
jgi:hypothetical protein